MSKKNLSYISLFFVVFIWGSAPLFTLELYNYFSPSVRLFLSEVVLVISYIAISGKHLKEFNWDYLKVGIPTGIFLSLANLSQKIGLLYTTPVKYAFLENLSCITVPILMFILVKKKPTFMSVLSCITCLVGIYILSGITPNDASLWGIGETLCATSGLLYGFNIAGTGVYAKKLYTPLYLAVQSGVCVIISLISTIILSKITMTSPEGEVIHIENVFYSLKPEHLVFLAIVAIVTGAVCWILRTNSMKYIDPAIVAVITPFSSVVTGVLSVITGKDILNSNLVIGGIFGIIAIIMSCWDDIVKRKACLNK